MKLKDVRLCMIVFLVCSVSVVPASAILLYNVNHILRPNGNIADHMTFGDVYLQEYEKLCIDIESYGSVNIQIRDGIDNIVEHWFELSGTINKSFVIQNDDTYRVYIENNEDFDNSLVGIIYVDSVDTTTPTTPTNNGRTNANDVQFILNIVTLIYIMAGVLFVISLFVWKRRRNPSYKFLIGIDNNELLPTDWNPDDEF